MPITIWQDYLIRRHLQVCPRCKEKIADIEEVRSWMHAEGREEMPEEAWVDLKRRLRGEEKELRIPFVSRWKWALSTAVLLLVIVVGLWIFRGELTRESVTEPESRDQFQINYIKVGDKPAIPFLFRPQGEDMTIIWAGRDF